MPTCSPPADGLIAIRAPMPAGRQTLRVDPDASLMATLTRLGSPPPNVAGRSGGRNSSPVPADPSPDAVILADLPRLAAQLHNETHVIRRQLGHSNR